MAEQPARDATDAAADAAFADILRRRLTGKFGHVIRDPHPDSHYALTAIITAAPLVPMTAAVPLLLPLLSNLRGELSEPSWNALSRVLGGLIKFQMLTEHGMAPVTAANADKVGTPDCPCLGCALARAAGIRNDTVRH